MSIYLITGAARGIGLELVRQLSSDASTIVIATVRALTPELQHLGDERNNVRIVTCDVSSGESVSSLSTTLPTVLPHGDKITHLLNNAGVVAQRDVQATSMTAEALTENITINTLGPARVTEAVLPFLAPNALIVNISSGIGSLQLLANGHIPPQATAYSVSKAALNMLTVHQAYELKGRYRVVCLDPGHVKTRLGGDQAGVEIYDSAAGIIKTIGGLNDDPEGDRQNGKARFVDFGGKEVPW